jgi:hypothetical protein
LRRTGSDLRAALFSATKGTLRALAFAFDEIGCLAFGRFVFFAIHAKRLTPQAVSPAAMWYALDRLRVQVEAGED